MRLLVLPLFALAVAQSAFAADSLRCGTSLLSSDASVAEFLSKCGEPSSKEVHEEDVRATNADGFSYVVGKTRIEKWTYARDRRLPVVVTVIDGQVTSVETQVRP